MKYVQRKIIQERISGVNSMRRNFQRERYCPEGNFFRSNCSGVVVFAEIIQGYLYEGKSPGVNCLGVEFHSG